MAVGRPGVHDVQRGACVRRNRQCGACHANAQVVARRIARVGINRSHHHGLSVSLSRRHEPHRARAGAQQLAVNGADGTRLFVADAVRPQHDVCAPRDRRFHEHRRNVAFKECHRGRHPHAPGEGCGLRQSPLHGGAQQTFKARQVWRMPGQRREHIDDPQRSTRVLRQVKRPRERRPPVGRRVQMHEDPFGQEGCRLGHGRPFSVRTRSAGAPSPRPLLLPGTRSPATGRGGRPRKPSCRSAHVLTG